MEWSRRTFPRLTSPIKTEAAKQRRREISRRLFGWELMNKCRSNGDARNDSLVHPDRGRYPLATTSSALLFQTFPHIFAYYSPMGGEPASTSRMRLIGKVCCVCRVSLKPDPTHPNQERYCDRCAPRRRVYMSFFSRSGWYCQFLEEDLKTPLPRKLNFATADKILELAEHSGALKDLACRQAIEHGISVGREAFDLCDKMSGANYCLTSLKWAYMLLPTSGVSCLNLLHASVTCSV